MVAHKINKLANADQQIFAKCQFFRIKQIFILKNTNTAKLYKNKIKIKSVLE